MRSRTMLAALAASLVFAAAGGPASVAAARDYTADR
jgi:hypothetical protein